MTKRHPRQEACLRQAAGFSAASSDGSSTTLMPKSHSVLCEDAETFRRRMEAVSLLEGRACREVIWDDTTGITATTTTTRGISTRRSSNASGAAAAAAATVLKFACQASAACRFCMQAQQVSIRGMTGWKIVRSHAHSCTEQEHAQLNLCSEKSLVYFFRNELPWVTLHCDDDNNNEQQQQDWTTLTQQFAAHLQSKYGIDYVGGGGSAIRLRMLRRVLQQLTLRVATAQSSNNARTQSPKTVVLENLPPNRSAPLSTSAPGIATGMKATSPSATTSTNSSPTATQTSAIALRTRRKLDHPSVAAAASTSETTLKRKSPPPQSPTRASKRSRTQTCKEKAASSDTHHIVVTRSRSSQKQPSQEKQLPKKQRSTTSSDASSPRRFLRRGTAMKRVVSAVPVAARDSRRNKHSNDVMKGSPEATIQPVRKSQRVRTPSKKMQESLSTSLSQPARATRDSPETSQRVLRSRTVRETPEKKNDDKSLMITVKTQNGTDSQQAPIAPNKETPKQVLSVNEFLHDYDERASSQRQLYYPLYLTGLSSSEALEIVRDKLEELEIQKKKLRAPPPPVEKQVEDDMRDYRRSLKSLSLLRENEMLMRHKEKEQDEQAYTQQRFFYRKQKKMPLALEMAAMTDRPIWWVNNSEFRRAASRKCCLLTATAAAAAGGTTACPLCSRPVIMTTAAAAAAATTCASPPTLVPRIRQVDLDELDEDEEEEGSRENSSSSDDRRVSRAAETHAKVHATCVALRELEASLAFVDNYNKTASLFGPK